MTEIEKLKEQIEKQQEYIEVIKTEQLYPAQELLSDYKINLAKAECPFEVGDKIVSIMNVTKGILLEPKAMERPWSIQEEGCMCVTSLPPHVDWNNWRKTK